MLINKGLPILLSKPIYSVVMGDGCGSNHKLIRSSAVALDAFHFSLLCLISEQIDSPHFGRIEIQVGSDPICSDVKCPRCRRDLLGSSVLSVHSTLVFCYHRVRFYSYNPSC